MKTKLREFIQHLSHQVEDEDKAEEYLDSALPYIGLIVMYFNSLESSLDSVLCENFTDRTDATGLIVLNKMNYSAKVDLLKRFYDDFQIGLDNQLNGYEQLITDLRESARLRNMVAHAKSSNKYVYDLIPNIYGDPSLPVPFMNILNGGAHADNSVDIQEFMIVPHGFTRFDDGLKAGVEVYHTLKKRLKDKGLATNVGDEGGFAPNFTSSKEVLDEIMLSIAEAGYKPSEQISLALDAAASEFYKDGKYLIEGNSLTNIEMSDYLVDLTDFYPIVSIEDGLAEDDWDGWKYLTSKINDSTQLVGDDLFVTQEEVLQKGIDENCGNAILIKVNQVGSVTETLNTMELASKNAYSSMVSHRSGETEDSFISHLVVGTSSGQIKTGAPARSERTAKYNELLRIAETIGFENYNNSKWQI